MTNAGFQVEILWQQLRGTHGAGEAALDPVLIHKHRARVSPRKSWLPPRSLLHCFFVIKRHRNGKHLVVQSDEMLITFLELQAAIHRRFELE